jgi:hypothetical protein
MFDENKFTTTDMLDIPLYGGQMSAADSIQDTNGITQAFLA